jgi:hypothetical protein
VVAEVVCRREICLALAAASLGLLQACATEPGPRTVDLEFLKNPGVTRSDVETRLGPPAASFDRDHVTTYRLNRSSDGFLLMTQLTPVWRDLDWANVTHDLVLAYDADGRLVEYRLVTVHVQPEPH